MEENQDPSQPHLSSLSAAGDADSALNSLVGQNVRVLTTFSEGTPFAPAVFVGSLLAVFPDAIVVRARLFPEEAQGEVLIYKHAIVAVIPTAQ
jgi:hypothetical protein